MNINDVYIDQATAASFLPPLFANMEQRGYPKNITDRIALLKSETDKLLADLGTLCNEMRTPDVPGIPGMAGTKMINDPGSPQ